MGENVLAVVEDLFFLVQIRDAAKRTGCSIGFVQTPPDLRAKAATATLAIVDLNASKLKPLEMIAAAKSAGLEVLAFVPHVQTDLKRQALDAGADRVVARSNFAQHLNATLEKIAPAR